MLYGKGFQNGLFFPISIQQILIFEVHYKSSVVFEVSFLMCQSCFAAMRESSQHPLSTQTHCAQMFFVLLGCHYRIFS